MSRKDKRKLEIFIFGVALVSIVISLTATDSFDVKLDDLPSNNYHSQNPPLWQSEVAIGTATGTRISSERGATLVGSLTNA